MCREVNEDFLEFECHLKLDVDILSSGIPYKYFVYGTNRADVSEYLHDVQGWETRCLRMNNQSEESKNYFVWVDSIL